MRQYSFETEVRVVQNLSMGSDALRMRFFGEITAEHFGAPPAKEAFRRLLSLLQNNKPIPSCDTLYEDPVLSEDAQALFTDILEPIQEDEIDSVVEILETHRKIRVLTQMVQSTAEALDKENTDVGALIGKLRDTVELACGPDRIKEAYDIGEDDTSCEVVAHILQGDTAGLLPTGFEEFDRKTGGWQRGNLVVFAANSGGGKCLGFDTPVLMFDGTIKKVQDIVVGDQVMGPDSRPRIVKSLCRGQEDMFKIIPVKGEPFTCNRSHILSFKVSTMGFGHKHGDIVNMSVDDYLKKSKNKNAVYKLWRTGVDFAGSQSFNIPPYLIGLWLGDGSRAGANITNCDSEIIEYLKETLPKLGGRLYTNSKRQKHYMSFNRYGEGRPNENPILIECRKCLNENGEKHIPKKYLTASREDRLNLLAGLLDTDGYLHHNFFEITTKYESLKNDILFLARSLGFAAYTFRKKATIKSINFSDYYYKINISGDVDQIPCRVERRKAAPRKQVKSAMVTGFKIEELGRGNYYGFELTGGQDQLFLLGDFTVTHNSSLALQTAINQYRAGHEVGVVSLEMDHEELTAKAMSNVAQVPHTDIRLKETTAAQQKKIVSEWESFVELGKQKKNRITFYCPKQYSVTAQDIILWARPRKFDVLYIDYIGLLAGMYGDDQAKALSRVAMECKRAATMLNCVVVILAQLDDQGRIKYSRGIGEHANFIWTWRRNEESIANGLIEIVQTKARAAPIYSFSLSENFCMSEIKCDDMSGDHIGNKSFGQPTAVSENHLKQPYKKKSRIIMDEDDF